jgi:hypothetical protein
MEKPCVRIYNKIIMFGITKKSKSLINNNRNNTYEEQLFKTHYGT